MEEKNEKKDIENNNLKKNLKEIKQYITNGYNKFILELNNNEKNIEDVLNINHEINKKKEIEDPKYEKENMIYENNNSDNIEKKYLNTESNFYSRNNSIINNREFFNNSATERKISINKKEPFEGYKEKDSQSIQPIYHIRKVPSLNVLPNKIYHDYKRRRFFESSNK